MAWYRNPSAATGSSLRIAYQDKHDAWHSVQPDFIFINEVNGVYRPSILDPHGAWLPDAKDKLLALAEYARDHEDVFHRIEALASVDKTDNLLSIDMLDAPTRTKVLAAKETSESADDIYKAVGTPYASPSAAAKRSGRQIR